MTYISEKQLVNTALVSSFSSLEWLLIPMRLGANTCTLVVVVVLSSAVCVIGTCCCLDSYLQKMEDLRAALNAPGGSVSHRLTSGSAARGTPKL